MTTATEAGRTAKPWRSYSQMKEFQAFGKIRRIKAGHYEIDFDGATWKVWRGLRGNWYVRSDQRIHCLIEASTFSSAKCHLRNKWFDKNYERAALQSGGGK